MRRVPQRHQYRFRQPEFRECKWSVKSPTYVSLQCGRDTSVFRPLSQSRAVAFLRDEA